MALLLAACSPAPAAPAATGDSIATAVAATLEAAAASNAPTSEPAQSPEGQPATGLVQGNLCYPSSDIPAMTVFLEDSAQNLLFPLDIAQNQTSYQAEVSPGTYSAYAWLPDYGYGGSYSQAVPCGLSVECSDHSLIQFTVAEGETVTGIDICDWYGGPDSVPLPPGIEPPTGSISGSLSYPSSFIPPLIIVATEINTGNYYYILTTQNTTTYELGGLPAGQYTVVAYVADDPSGYSAGYSAAVPCGLSVNCSDHSLLVITLAPGQNQGGVDPQDWYAPPGSFPPNPAP